MPIKRQKICLLFYGGTTLSTRPEKGNSVEKEGDIWHWMKKMPELEIIAEIDPIFLAAKKASEVGPADWLSLAREVYKRINRYDGFVITHGVDTVAYTASALSFLLPNLNKPVVLTGSQIDPNYQKEDKKAFDNLFKDFGALGVRANLINAIQVATMDLAEVAIIFGNRLVRGNQAIKADIFSLNVFEGLKGDILGKVDFGIRLFENRRKRSASKPMLAPPLEERVKLLELQPGMDEEFLKQFISGSRGLVLKAYKGAIISDKIKKVLESLKIPVVIISYYPPVAELKSPNLIYLSGLTQEAVFTKLMWVLGRTRDLKKIKVLMRKNTANEFKGEEIYE